MKKLQRNNVYARGFTVFGHRGVPSLFQENTIQSFQKAIDLKYDGIELDVVTTKDGMLIVHHDKEIKVNAHFEQIINLEYGDILSSVSEAPPTLDSVLSRLGHQTNINIEIKDQGKGLEQVSEKVVKRLKNLNLIDNVVVSSFNPRVIKHIKNLDDRFATAWIWGNKNFYFFNSWKLVLKYFKPQAIHISYKLINERLVKKIQANNIKVLAYTVNQEKDFLEIISKKIDGIFTDFPSILRLARKQDLKTHP